MSAVQDADLTFFIRFYIVCPDDIGIRFMYGQFIRPLFISFDDPEIEELACVDDIVFIAQLFFKVRDFIPRISGDDAVYQCAGEFICCVYPLCEFLTQFPFFRVFQDDAL